jgi:type IV secretory pathway VirD2 relaxase
MAVGREHGGLFRATISISRHAQGALGPVWSLMVKERDSDIRIRPSRTRGRSSGGNKGVIAQVLRAAQKAGHVSPITSSARSGRRFNGSTFGRGRGRFGRARLFGSTRRVVIKARVVRHKGKSFRSAPLAAHLGYLKRDGVSRDGEKGHMFDARADQADDVAFAERCQDDRHHFRFIISPEDAAELEDLKAFTRDLARQMEADLGSRLDWVAAEHWNTDNPHIHLLVRGVAEDGGDLVISRDYISHGLRSRAEELASIELGPKPEHEIRAAITRDITAERWTRLDTEIRLQADDLGFIDLRPANPGPCDPEIRRLMIGRLQHLEIMGLATPAGSAEWMIQPDTEPRLRDLAMRGDIIKTMHRAFTSRGQDRGIADYVIDGDAAASPIIGRLVDKGLHDELTGQAYAVIDGTDGRAHHIRLSGIDAFDHAPPVGGIVEVRRFGGPDDPRPTLVLANRSDLDLQAQVKAAGATWLDHRLVERGRMPLAIGGFGGEAREAMRARAEHLVEQGFGRRDGGRILLQRDLLATLRQRELEATGKSLAAETGLAHLPVTHGADVSGTYRRQMNLSLGRFAMIAVMSGDGGLGFQLVPWSREIDRKLGQQIKGAVRGDGGIDWSIGRKRDLGIGI